MPPQRPQPPLTAHSEAPDPPAQRAPTPSRPSPDPARLPLTQRDPEHVIAHELARSLRTLMQIALIPPTLDAPPTLERAYLAAHAWSLLVRSPLSTGGFGAIFWAPAVSVTLLRQLAVRHAACALEDFRRQVRTLSLVQGMTLTAQRTLMRVTCDLDTSEFAVSLALRLVGRSAGFDTDSAARQWRQRAVGHVSSTDR